jgi:signal transduction histidine kinase
MTSDVRNPLIATNLRTPDLPSLMHKADELVSTEDDPRVLIIDDEALLVEELAESLDIHGFGCKTATDPTSGMELFFAVPSITIVIADIRMPGMSGLDMYKELKKKVPPERNFEIIIITGHADRPDAVQALKLGAIDFLSKPIMGDDLLQSVKRADQKIKLCVMEREFKDRLETQVVAKTAELQNKVSELAAVNTKLALANQIKNEFMGMISHELRTPLNAIIGLANVFENKLSDPDHLKYVAGITDAGWRLTHIVNSIIDIVAVETETLKLHLSKILISDLIEHTIEIYLANSEKAQVKIDASGIPEMTMVVDQLRITQALGRLIDNAIKFSPAGGTVRITTNQIDGKTIISVRDDGPGMSEQDLERAFEPLCQVDASTTKTHEGIGVGISLAKMFAELHGGTLEIDSVSGHGTTASIILPNVTKAK